MGRLSPEAKTALFGAVGLLAVVAATTQVEPVSVEPHKASETDKNYSKLLGGRDVVDESRLPFTLVVSTPTPRAIPTLEPRGKIEPPRLVPTVASQVIPRATSVPERIPAVASATPAPATRVERNASPTVTNPEIEVQTAGVVYGPPYNPEDEQAGLFAEIGKIASDTIIPLGYGALAYAAGYATKKYLRP